MTTVTPIQNVYLRRLADFRWRELRRAHNRMFMTLAPGPEWEGYKADRAEEFTEIRVLREYLGLKDD